MKLNSRTRCPRCSYELGWPYRIPGVGNRSASAVEGLLPAEVAGMPAGELAGRYHIGPKRAAVLIEGARRIVEADEDYERVITLRDEFSAALEEAARKLEGFGRR